MITFAGQSLFASGPAAVQPRARALRAAQRPAAGGEGSRLIAAGLESRELIQQGTLLADNVEQLFDQIVAIENHLDAQPAELRDAEGNVWPDAVMVEFDLGDIRHTGRRVKADYRATYMQTHT